MTSWPAHELGAELVREIFTDMRLLGGQVRGGGLVRLVAFRLSQNRRPCTGGDQLGLGHPPLMETSAAPPGTLVSGGRTVEPAAATSAAVCTTPRSSPITCPLRVLFATGSGSLTNTNSPRVQFTRTDVQRRHWLRQPHMQRDPPGQLVRFAIRPQPPGARCAFGLAPLIVTMPDRRPVRVNTASRPPLATSTQTADPHRHGGENPASHRVGPPVGGVGLAAFDGRKPARRSRS